MIGGAGLLITVVATHVTTQVEIARLSERVDNVQTTNAQTLHVMDRLATSIDSLSQSVARLDERTRMLEREQ